jgi:hypothetical protein
VHKYFDNPAERSAPADARVPASVSLGGVEIRPATVLAPMAGITDTVFRRFIRNLGGCGLMMTEFTSAEGIIRHKDKKAKQYLTFYGDEHPISAQLFGSDPATLAEAARVVEAMGFDLVDLNLGCPAKKVVKCNGGSGLLRDLPLIKNIFESREIDPARTVAKIATVQTEGGRSVTREIEFYRLEVILAVGYRVKSARGTQFRQWATAQLEQYLVKGFAMDDERLKQAGGGNYFDELLARIRDIRSSERSLPRFRGTPGAQPQAHDDARMDRQAGQFPEAERPRTADTRRDHLPRRCAGQGGIRVRQVPGNRKRQAAARRYGFRECH